MDEKETPKTLRNADPERFDADSQPAFHADLHLDPDL